MRVEIFSGGNDKDLHEKLKSWLKEKAFTTFHPIQTQVIAKDMLWTTITIFYELD